ncbi:addiction module toxin, HicA family [bacterium]|nr:MAG: addiction module toxin, HicA family [bacterium]
MSRYLLLRRYIAGSDREHRRSACSLRRNRVRDGGGQAQGTPRRVKPANSKTIIKAIERKGWRKLRQRGSHVIFIHEVLGGVVIVPDHGSRDLPTGTQADIMKKAGLTDNDIR